MDTNHPYRQLIEDILTEYAQVPYAYGDMPKAHIILAFRSPEVRQHTEFTDACL